MKQVPEKEIKAGEKTDQIVLNRTGERSEENKTDTPQEYKSWKEQTYDQIPISVKTLDIIIFILIAVLFLMYTYFIYRK